MRFYHLSLDTLFPQTIFTPRIPEDTLRSEDTETPRICVSTSIEGCLTAAPWGGTSLECEMDDVEIFKEDGTPFEERGILIRVYEFEYNGPMLNPEYLHRYDLVRDAILTDEHWLLEECTPSITYTILLTDWDEISEELISHGDSMRIAENPSYDLGFDDPMTTISNIKYKVITSESLAKIINSFNEKCKNRQYSMYFDYVEPIHTLYKEYTSNKALNTFIMDKLYNKDSNMLIPLLKELVPVIKALKEYTDNMNGSKELANSLVDDLIEKLENKVELKKGCARVAFIFENFVIKTEYTKYSDQFNEEFNEYYYTILNAVKQNTNTHALLPLISIINLEGIEFEIFPKADTSVTYTVETKWYEEQSSIRNYLGFDYVELEYSDLVYGNLGYYNGELVIIDAGALGECQE